MGAQPDGFGGGLARRFRLLRKLGQGGMGEVYAAEVLQTGEPVAIKVLRSDYLGDTVVRARFLDEGRTCVGLTHPNIVKVLDCGETEDGIPYLVMELLEGVPLSAYMQNGARVPLAQAVPILQGVLAGLAAAHGRGIVHRDLKPDNVFLTRDAAGRFVVKLLDFGIAKVIDAAGGMVTRTRSGVLLGTPAYMSPEQARNARDVDQRADLWSAGALLYEMLAGRPVFPAPTEFARLAALLTADPEPIDRIDPSLAPLASLLRRALSKDRDARFASALEMSKALASSTEARSHRSERAAAWEDIAATLGSPRMTSPMPPQALQFASADEIRSSGERPAAHGAGFSAAPAAASPIHGNDKEARTARGIAATVKGAPAAPAIGPAGSQEAGGDATPLGPAVAAAEAPGAGAASPSGAPASSNKLPPIATPGTLASVNRGARRISEPVPHVEVRGSERPRDDVAAGRPETLRPLGSTLESHPPETRARPRAVAIHLVVIFVSLSFAAGVIVGWVLARVR